MEIKSGKNNRWNNIVMTKSASVVNIGIIGPGRVAERHASAINQISNGRLWSIAGRSIDDTQCFASKYNAQDV